MYYEAINAATYVLHSNPRSHLRIAQQPTQPPTYCTATYAATYVLWSNQRSHLRIAQQSTQPPTYCTATYAATYVLHSNLHSHLRIAQQPTQPPTYYTATYTATYVLHINLRSSFNSSLCTVETTAVAYVLYRRLLQPTYCTDAFSCLRIVYSLSCLHIVQMCTVNVKSAVQQQLFYDNVWNILNCITYTVYML